MQTEIVKNIAHYGMHSPSDWKFDETMFPMWCSTTHKITLPVQESATSCLEPRIDRVNDCRCDGCRWKH